MVRLFMAALTLALFVPAPAIASAGACLEPHQEAELARFEQRLANADDVDQARRIAVRRLKPTRGVLRQAQRLAPSDPGLIAGAHGLDELELRVNTAESPEQVASAFRGLRASADGEGCNLTTGETIATVIGFVLGILPGIILLILLC